MHLNTYGLKKKLFFRDYITGNINYLEGFEKHIMCWKATLFPRTATIGKTVD